MEQKQVTKELMNIYLNLATEESYSKKEAAEDLLQVIKQVEESGE